MLRRMALLLLPTAPSLRLNFSLVWYFTRRSSVLLCVSCLRQNRTALVQRMYPLAQVKVLLNFSLFSDSNFHSFVKHRYTPLLLYDIILIRLANCCMLSKKRIECLEPALRIANTMPARNSFIISTFFTVDLHIQRQCRKWTSSK